MADEKVLQFIFSVHNKKSDESMVLHMTLQLCGMTYLMILEV